MGVNHPSPALSSLQAERIRGASPSGWSTTPSVRGACDENTFPVLCDEDDENVTELSS